MSEKKQLNAEELEKVSGGTYTTEDGYVFYTMDEIKKLHYYQPVSAYQITEGGYIKSWGLACFIKLINDTTAEIKCGNITFTVGDNDEYFIGPSNI